MCVYNGLLPTANMTSPKYNSKTSFCQYKANIFYRIFQQTTVIRIILSYYFHVTIATTIILNMEYFILNGISIL